MTSYDLLIQKLDEFIRKYYKNRLIKGLIYAISLLAIFFIVINTFEYFGHFSILIRTILFYSFVLISAIITGRYFIYPLLKLYRIGKIISYEQAAQIIGKHFTNVQDKLLNTLQLKHLSDDNNTSDNALIEASINQKINELKPVPFATAIDIKANRKYLKYAIPPVLLIIIFLFAAPSFITEPSKRIIKHNTFYEKPAPFSFMVTNTKLEAIQQADFDLNIKVLGNDVPDEAFILIEGIKYKLQKLNTVNFKYTFKSVQRNVDFQLTSGEITTKPYVLKIIPKPIILNFDVKLRYPAYTGKKDETIDNAGDIVIPDGTKVEWRFFTKDTRNLMVSFGDKGFIINNKGNNIFNYGNIFRKSINYSVKPENAYLKINDSLVYSINVVPDAYPTIQVEEFKDSVYEKRMYFRGMIKDDYGFNKLLFHFRTFNATDSSKSQTKDIVIDINKSNAQQQFLHYFDLSTLITQAGDEIEYYFEVWDNDGVNGSKSSRTQRMMFKAPTLKEIDKQTEKDNQELKDNMEKAMLDSKKLQKQVKELNRKLMDKKSLNFEEKKQVKELLEKQQQLQKEVENIKLQNKENATKEQQYKKLDEEIMLKQKELEKLFEDVMNDEMKKKFEELQKLMENIDKDKVNDMLEKMKMNSEDISKQLDRNLEIFKKLEFEKKLSENIDKLDKLADEQKKLAEETKNSDKNDDKLKEKQDQLNKDFQDFKKNMDDLEKKNQELEKPQELNRDQKKEEEISKEQQNSSKDLNDKKNSKASKSQQKAAEEMKQMAEKMKEQQDKNEMEEEEEDAEAIRALLKNLITISFKEEELMKKTGITSVKDPKYQEVINEQGNIKDDLKMIEDSLLQLSKRQIKIQPIINKEISSINDNVEKVMNDLLAMNTVGYIGNFQNNTAVGRQQYIMTSVNNLALLLAESLDKMKSDMQSKSESKKSGNKSCKKPGTGKSNSKSMKSMRQMQEELNKQIEQMKAGQKPNGQKLGQGKTMSEQLARMAAQQEAIRRQMQQYAEELKKQGQKPGNDFNDLMNQMDKTETDLVNKMISQETLNRQKQILTRLLEHEKAELKRDQEEKRESIEAKDQKYGNLNKFFQYKSIKSNEQDLLKTVPPVLNSFYKNKVNEYFYNFE